MKSYHPRHIHHHFLRNLHIPTAFLGIMMIMIISSASTFLFAATAVNFQMIINPGTLAVNIVDNTFTPVLHPQVNMGEVIEDTDCQSVHAFFGTETQKIYVRNPDSADSGWNVTLSAASPTDLWSSNEGFYFDFNDPVSLGCSDGSDGDTVAGQMTVDPSFTSSNVVQGQCMISCDTDGIAKGSLATFEENVRDTITLLSGTSESSDAGDWVLTGVRITQSIPANQSYSEQYHLDLYLSITAT